MTVTVVVEKKAGSSFPFCTQTECNPNNNRAVVTIIKSRPGQTELNSSDTTTLVHFQLISVTNLTHRQRLS